MQRILVNFKLILKPYNRHGLDLYPELMSVAIDTVNTGQFNLFKSVMEYPTHYD